MFVVEINESLNWKDHDNDLASELLRGNAII